MAKKSGVPSTELQKCLSRIKASEKIRDEADKKFGYTRSIAEYNGNYKDQIPTFMAGVDLIPINEVYAFAKTFVPSVYSRDPYLAVNPKGTKYVVGAKILELSVNAYWRELNIKRQIRRCLFDAIFAEGWIKCGYSSSLGSIEKPDDSPALFPSQYIQNEEIFAQRVSWKNIVRDPDATDGIYDARFVAHQLIFPLDAVKNSDLYENTKDLEANYTLERSGPDVGSGRGPIYTVQEKYIVLYEVWDKDEEKVYTIADGGHDYLMNKKWPYKFNGYPFEMIRFNDATDEAYAPNMIAPWEPQLWEKMKIRSMELDHIKRFGRQLACEKGSLTKMEMDKFKKGISGSVIQFEQGRLPPQPIQYPPIQPDIYAIENRIDMDKDNISGQPSVIRAAPQKTSSRTLGEVDRLISSFQSRQNDPQAVVEEFAQDIAKKLIGLMQQYWKKDKYISASQVDVKWLEREAKDNPMSDRIDEKGFMMKPEDIKNLDFEVEVRSGSALPLDKKTRVQSMVSIVDMGPKIGVQPGDKTSRVIGKNLVSEFDMPEITAAFEEGIDQQEKQQEAMIKGRIMAAQNALDTVKKVRNLHGAMQQAQPADQTIPPELLGQVGQ